MNKKSLTRIAVVLLMLGGSSYHVYAVESLENEIEESNDFLEQQKLDNQKKLDATVAELEKLEKDRQDLENQLENKDKELSERDKTLEENQKEIDAKKEEIEKLQGELQAKLESKSNLASAHNEKEDKESTDDKSQILSNEKEVKPEHSEEEVPNNEQNTNIGTFSVTYYSAYDGTQSGTTAGGTNMANGNIYTSDGYRIVAVDKNVIPMGTILLITTSNGETFKAKADDTGGAIKGNKIDIAVSDPNTAFELGRGTATVEIVK